MEVLSRDHSAQSPPHTQFHILPYFINLLFFSLSARFTGWFSRVNQNIPAITFPYVIPHLVFLLLLAVLFNSFILHFSLPCPSFPLKPVFPGSPVWLLRIDLLSNVAHIPSLARLVTSVPLNVPKQHLSSLWSSTHCLHSSLPLLPCLPLSPQNGDEFADSTAS